MTPDCRQIFNAIERLTEIDPDLARDLLACFEDTKRPQFWEAARRLGHMEGAKSAYVAAMEAVERATLQVKAVNVIIEGERATLIFEDGSTRTRS